MTSVLPSFITISYWTDGAVRALSVLQPLVVAARY